MDSQAKILIIRKDHIGDLALSTAVFREIKKFLPNSNITLICSQLNSSLIKENPYIDETIELDTKRYNIKGILNYFKVIKRIKKEKFDVGIDLRGSLMNSMSLLWIPRIKKRISRIDYHPIIKHFLTIPVKINPKMHAIEENIRIINKGLEIKSENNQPEIFLSKKDEFYVNKFLKKNKIKKYICLCPVALLKNKQWSLENWGKLIKKLKGGYTLLLIGTSKEKKLLGKLAKLNNNCKIIIDFNLRQMLLLFKKSSLVIAQDGGPMHIAWISKTKVIEIASEENPIIASGKYFPLGHSSVLIAKGKDIDKIKPNYVKKEIKKILNESKRKNNKIIKII